MCFPVFRSFISLKDATIGIDTMSRQRNDSVLKDSLILFLLPKIFLCWQSQAQSVGWSWLFHPTKYQTPLFLLRPFRPYTKRAESVLWFQGHAKNNKHCHRFVRIVDSDVSPGRIDFR